MKHFVLGTAAILLAATGPASAQRAPFNDAGVTMGHWHLNSKDVEANKKILVAMGGTAIKPGDFEIVNVPGINVFLHLRPGTPPATGGTVDSVINHVGFLVPNVQAAVTKWKEAGVPVLPGTNGRTDQAFVMTPDGVRIEILEDKDQKEPIKHHHVHWYVPEAQMPEIQAWYGKHFNAKPGKRGNFLTAYIPGAELAFTKTDKPTVPTLGRTLDHIGFDVKSMDETVKRLEAGGIKLDRPVATAPNGSKLTFIHDPWGASIELNERPGPL